MYFKIFLLLYTAYFQGVCYHGSTQLSVFVAVNNVYHFAISPNLSSDNHLYKLVN